FPDGPMDAVDRGGDPRLHPGPSAAPSNSVSSPMLLLSHSVVERELRLIARKLVRRQRLTEEATPSLFIILPTVLPTASPPNPTPTLAQQQQYSSQTQYPYQQSSHHAPYSQPLQESPMSANCFMDGIRQYEYRLYFLCDYMNNESGKPQLHLCMDMGQDNGQGQGQGQDTSGSTSAGQGDNKASQSARGEDMEVDQADQSNEVSSMMDMSANGHRLRNLRDFCEDYKIPMLSLLRMLQDNTDRHMFGTTMTDPTLGARIRTALRFLASMSFEELTDLRDAPSEEDEESRDGEGNGGADDDDEEEEDAGDYDEFPTLNPNDFLDPSEVLKEGIILGSLCPLNMRSKETYWMCMPHNEMFCKVAAAETLRAFIHEHQGDCIPMERSAEIQLHSREGAREFYRMLVAYQCVMKLKISLAWSSPSTHLTESNEGGTSAVGGSESLSGSAVSAGVASGRGVTEEDLWDLCDMVHATNIRELTVDCSSLAVSGPDSFRPFFGIIYREGFISLTIENYPGQLPWVQTVERSGHSFSLRDLRRQPASMPSHPILLPKGNQLQKLVLTHWAHVPDIERVCDLVRVVPKMKELEIECEHIELAVSHLYSATNEFHHTGYIKLVEGSREEAEFTFLKASGRSSASAGRRPFLRRKTGRHPDMALSTYCQLESLVTLHGLDLYHEQASMSDLVSKSQRSLKHLELGCHVGDVYPLWSSILNKLGVSGATAMPVPTRNQRRDHYYHHSQPQAQFYMRMYSVGGEYSLSTERPGVASKTQVAVHSYPIDDDVTRRRSRMMEDELFSKLPSLATGLVIGAEMTSADEMERFAQAVERNGLPYSHLTWYLTAQTASADTVSHRFMGALRSVVHRQEVKSFTIKVYGGHGLDVIMLLKAWNELTGLGLGVEHQIWIQRACVELEHPFEQRFRPQSHHSHGQYHVQQQQPLGSELSFTSEDEVMPMAGLTAAAAAAAATGSEPGMACHGPSTFSLSYQSVVTED
ncbi:hypothetical protein BGW38_005333, partial [Lunasporangiospora selenospora]